MFPLCRPFRPAILVVIFFGASLNTVEIDTSHSLELRYGLLFCTRGPEQQGGCDHGSRRILYVVDR